jgi:hypothetical protein
VAPLSRAASRISVMNETMVVLHLKDCCIESAVKKEYKRLMDLCFAADENEKYSGIEEQIGLLAEFLGLADFPSLRALDDRLSGERESRVTIGYDDMGRPGIVFIEV